MKKLSRAGGNCFSWAAPVPAAAAAILARPPPREPLPAGPETAASGKPHFRLSSGCPGSGYHQPGRISCSPASPSGAPVRLSSWADVSHVTGKVEVQLLFAPRFLSRIKGMSTCLGKNEWSVVLCRRTCEGAKEPLGTCVRALYCDLPIFVIYRVPSGI